MKALLITALQLYKEQGKFKDMSVEEEAKCVDSLYLFMIGVLERQLRDKRIKTDVIKAVTSPMRENSLAHTTALVETFRYIEEFKRKEGSKGDVVGSGEGVHTDRGE